MKRTTKIATAALSLVTVLGVGTAWAGSRWGGELTIDWTNLRAEGTMGTVRASANDLEYIGCALRATAPNTVRVTCMARDESGRSLQCGSAQPAMVQAVSAMISNSHIMFRASPTNGECLTIHVDNFSYNTPVVP